MSSIIRPACGLLFGLLVLSFSGCSSEVGSEPVDQGTADLRVCRRGLAACGTACVNLSTDPSNCGRCRNRCSSGSCSAGVCLVAAPLPSPVTYTMEAVSVSGLATDGTAVFWTDSGDNTVNQISTPGAQKIVLAAVEAQINQPTDIAVDPPSGSVIFLNFAGLQIGCTTRVPAGGAPATPFIGILGELLAPPPAHGLLSSGAFLNGAGDVFLNGCNTFFPFVVDNSAKSGKVLAQTPSGFLYGDPGDGTVSITGAGGAIASVPNQAGVDYVATDGTFAYWATSDLALRRTALTSIAPQTILTTTAQAVTGLATDGTNVYYATASGIFAVSVNGGAVIELSSTPGRFLTYSSGAIFYATVNSIFSLATP